MKSIFYSRKINLFFFLLIPCWALTAGCSSTTTKQVVSAEAPKNVHTAPDTTTIPDNEFGQMVRYGRELIMNTPYYIGPDGVVSHNLRNRMSCKNCHLDGGTRPFGLNFFSTHARYPQYRGREDRILNVGERINNCIERPHNGIALPLDSKEIMAMSCYIQWLSSGVEVGGHVYGDGAAELEYLARAASVENGAHIYATHCSSCHGKNGEGTLNFDASGYEYPPLWGSESYAAGSSMHRVLKAAKFIKANMPHKKSTWDKPFLADHEAIDVAAFINDDRIHARPEQLQYVSYPKINSKPIDYHKGPFADTFSAMQHKFGPYQPIVDYHKQHDLPVIF